MRRTIGSSDAAAVLGLHPYKSPFSVWARVTGLVEDGSSDSAAALRGRRLEGALLTWYAQDEGVEVTPGPRLDEPPFVHPEAPWCTARPDGLVGRTVGVEGKTAGKLSAEAGWGPAGTDMVPMHYRVQEMWQMVAVPELERVDLCALGTWADDWRIYRMARHDARLARLFRSIGNWWEEYVLPAKLPPVDGSADCSSVLAALYPTAAPKAFVEPTEADLALARDLARVRAEAAEVEARKVTIENALRLRIGDAYGLRGVATWAPTKGRETIDAARLKADLPEVAQQYTKVGEPGRTFRFNFKESDE